DAQIERLEKELGRLRGGVLESLSLMEGREIGVGLQYEQLTHASAALREELHTELERMLNDIIKFKIHVQGSLEAYEEFVASEVEREMAEQEGVEDQEDVAMEIEEEDDSDA
ncbi:kinetochore-associated Ndc80 complex subunit ndc80, partial [Oleoguttula sp. CCFEE 5521]